MHSLKRVVFITLSLILAACAVHSPYLPDPTKPALIRIIKGPDGMPMVTPEEIVVLPGQQVIFMGKEDFDLDFIGLSPIDLSVGGQKRFNSQDKDVIFTSEKFDRFSSPSKGFFEKYLDTLQRDKKDGFYDAETIKTLKDKKPIIREKYVEIYYNVKIGSHILDPKLKRILE